jgi:hypothetical protein
MISNQKEKNKDETQFFEETLIEENNLLQNGIKNNSKKKF